MSYEEDPPRLSDPGGDASEPVRKVVQECRNDVATPAQLDDLESRLTPLLWAPPPVSSPAGGSVAGVSGILKLAAVAIAAGAAGGLFWMGTTQDASAPKSVMPVLAPRPQPHAAATLPAPAAPVPTAAIPSAPKAKPTAPHTPVVAQSEADLLGAAQIALGQDPSRALALTDQHRTAFPGGVLSQEREVIAIEALERLGRTADARARAERFLKAYPDSAHRSKIESLVGRKTAPQ